jgi:hypothetical protein
MQQQQQHRMRMMTRRKRVLVGFMLLGHKTLASGPGLSSSSSGRIVLLGRACSAAWC